MAYHAITLPGPLGGPVGRLWRAYEGSLQRRPLLTQAATSALLWGVGDALGQRLTASVCGGVGGNAGGLGRSKSLRRRRASLDMRQSALTAAFGGAVVGPIGSFWYSWLDAVVASVVGCCTNSQVLGKVAADALLYTPIYVSAFFAYGCAVVDGADPREIRERMVRELPSTVAASTFLWPPAMALVFKRVPVQHQLLIVNLLTVFEVAILSLLRTPTAREFVDRTVAVMSDSGRRLVAKAKAGAMPLLPGQRRRRTLPSKPLTGRLSLLEGPKAPMVHVLGAGAFDAPSGTAAALSSSALFSPALFAALDAANDGHAAFGAAHPTVSIPCPAVALSSSEFYSGSDSEPGSPRGEVAATPRARWRARGGRVHARV